MGGGGGGVGLRANDRKWAGCGGAGMGVVKTGIGGVITGSGCGREGMRVWFLDGLERGGFCDRKWVGFKGGSG